MATIFKGAATALITPLDKNGVNYEQLGYLIDKQIEAGTDGLVICGTTGEGATLTHREHEEVLRYSVERINGRVASIAGTGSNDAARAIELTKYAGTIGYDAALVVTPYYNKCTQNGLVRMFTEIADNSTIPLILYNVPSRTGVNIEPETYAKLADHPMIQGIKEANGNISKAVETARLVGDKLDIYSGNDDQIVPMLALGAKGVISVLSNVLPGETSRMCHLFFEGKIEESRRMQLEYLDLINALFCEVNPIPVKAAMNKLGFCENYLRLPLTQMEEEHAEKLFSIMRKHGIIE
ncbi:MAG: 4-hydroxy-tetrahydrodipicolinate synthase [Acutalibacteraceae bacterium]|nr:4-hydroxy-tetrahydrodipicolinate synthase [Oscillospiraceae bacterium]